MSEFKEIKIKKPETEKAVSEPDFSRPSLHFSFDEVPEMENLKLGKEYEIALKVKPSSITKREDTKEKGGSISLDILAYKMDIPNKEEAEKNSEGSYQQRD